MKHIVIGAHGNLAEAFLETSRMIAGEAQTAETSPNSRQQKS